MLIRDTASKLERWFYAGASEGKPGMRMSLIGYGSFQYEMKSGERVVWPMTFDQLDRDAVTALVKDIEETIQQDPIGSWRYSTYRIVSSSAGPGTA